VGEVTGTKQSETRGDGASEKMTAERRHMTNEQLIARLAEAAEIGDLSKGLRALSDYVGATGFMLLRHDVNSENSLDHVISSDWPFDLVRRSGAALALDLPRITSQQYCSVGFNVGRNRYVLTFLCPEDFILSQQRLRATGVHAGYLASLLFSEQAKTGRELELTDRELECLYWIAEGKTSDEIATIIGISKNTINNYITSVMRKTATRTRSEAIAYAVRNNLV
jgi:DNA-binding CsgD family transcriptional regulator